MVVGTFGLKPYLKIYIEEGFRSRTMITGSGEWYTGFLQMYWSPDSKICGVWLVANGSINGILYGFDSSTARQVNTSMVRDNIGRSIIEKYKLQNKVRADPAFDPFAWSLTDDTQIAFIGHAHDDEH